MASESLLETVAQHEGALMQDLDRAREEARQVVEGAHTAGASLLQESNVKLDGDVAAVRREAATTREAERAKIQQASTAQIEKIRAESTSKTSVVRDELIARVLPNTD
jgi:vacuolar-type H+-ATPase subunit H